MQQWLPPGLGARTLQQAVEQKPAAGLASLSFARALGGSCGRRVGRPSQGPVSGTEFELGSEPGQSHLNPGAGGHWAALSPFAAIVEKELRSLMRTVPLLWAMSVPLLFVLVIAGMFHHSPSSGMKSFPYAFPLCVAYALLGFTGLFYNSLGAEGAGIQLLFLSPTPIRTVLLAKNLLHSILFVLVGFAAGVLSCIRLGVPPFAVLAGTGAWLVFALPCNLAAGIIFSLTVPYRINPGRITRPAGAQANTLPAMLIQLGVLGVGVLIFWLCWSFQDPVAARAHIPGVGRGRILCLGACVALLG